MGSKHHEVPTALKDDKKEKGLTKLLTRAKTVLRRVEGSSKRLSLSGIKTDVGKNEAIKKK